MSAIALTFTIIGGVILLLLILSFISGIITIYFCNNHDHLYTNLLPDENKEEKTEEESELTKAFDFAKDEEFFNLENFFAYNSITSFDNKKISSYIHTEEKSNLYIMFLHGYTGYPSEKAHYIHDLYNKYHCNIFLIEQRGQTKSNISYLTMGYKEGKDLVSWCGHIVNKINKNAKIICYGESMGAATVLTALHFNYPHNVAGVISDASYSSIPSQYMFSSRLVAPPFISIFVVFGTILAYYFLFHMRVIKYSPINATKKKTIPLIFIHGENDSIVSYKSFLKFKKHINKEIDASFESFPNTDHVAAYYTETKRFLNISYSFIDKLIK